MQIELSQLNNLLAEYKVDAINMADLDKTKFYIFQFEEPQPMLLLEALRRELNSCGIRILILTGPEKLNIFELALAKGEHAEV